MIEPRTIFELIEPYLHSPEAIVITGMRRTGKTTLLNWAYEQILLIDSLFLTFLAFNLLGLNTAQRVMNVRPSIRDDDKACPHGKSAWKDFGIS